MNNIKRCFFSCLTVKLALILACATQVPPSGGPEDKAPPRIVHVVPENSSTMVPRDQVIEFQFSEGMNRKSLDNAVFITPEPGDGVDFKWKGEALQIILDDSLKEDRTYVITLGTDLRDLHGNNLQQSYTLAFSTGEKISDGSITGRVYSEQSPRGTLMWAYILDTADEPNPVERPGAYVTQADNNGKFTFTNLSAGRYRVFAIRDADNNRFYEPGLDGIGVPTRDVFLAGDTLLAENLNFRMTVKDTVGAALVSASAQDRVHLTLAFDEDLTGEGVSDTSNYRISLLNEKQERLPVRSAYLDALNKKEVQLTTAVQTGGAEYEVVAKNLTDMSGNPVDENYNRVEFIGSALPDTFRPKLAVTVPKDSARNVPLDSDLRFHFTESLKKESFMQSLSLKNTVGEKISGTYDWLTPASAVFSPEKSLRSLTEYIVEVELDSVLDLAGNAAGDSLRVIKFVSINRDTLSSISGTISDSDSTAVGAIFLTAKQNRTDGSVYRLELPQPGVYKFEDILPGIYTISGFRDRDEDGKYSYGTVTPFQPAERFFVSADSIKVRARWPNEGNNFGF